MEPFQWLIAWLGFLSFAGFISPHLIRYATRRLELKSHLEHNKMMLQHGEVEMLCSGPMKPAEIEVEIEPSNANRRGEAYPTHRKD